MKLHTFLISVHDGDLVVSYMLFTAEEKSPLRYQFDKKLGGSQSQSGYC
jgi:hypothetical protein